MRRDPQLTSHALSAFIHGRWQELDGDDKCLDISSAVDKGCWMLGAASVLFFVTGYAAMSLVRWRVGMGGDGQRCVQSHGNVHTLMCMTHSSLHTRAPTRTHHPSPSRPGAPG